MKQKRPINLDLTTIRFPIPAIVSILHRISGVILFLLIPLFLWMLSESLGSQYSFNALKAHFASPWITLVVWALLSALAYHLVAGVRHLIMDLGFGETLCGARASSYIALIISIVIIALLGVWLW